MSPTFQIPAVLRRKLLWLGCRQFHGHLVTVCRGPQSTEAAWKPTTTSLAP